jgi:tRNA(Phe) wybutosine-synthesizing methylase Tyw3
MNEKTETTKANTEVDIDFLPLLPAAERVVEFASRSSCKSEVT